MWRNEKNKNVFVYSAIESIVIVRCINRREHTRAVAVKSPNPTIGYK